MILRRGLSKTTAQAQILQPFYCHCKRTPPHEFKQSYSEVATNGNPGAELGGHPKPVAFVREGWLFVDSILPIQIAKWDLRRYFGLFRRESVLYALQSHLERVKAHDFKVVSLEPYEKDGGVFVRFIYLASDPDDALKTIEKELSQVASKHGDIPSWLGLSRGRAWLVKGTPWREDMDRCASPIISIAFDGPDVQEQSLYQLFRPFGRIKGMTMPTTVPAGTLRSSTIQFSRLHSATIARNVLHGFHYSPLDNTGKTRLRAQYERPVQAHTIRHWMSSHPKIMLPLLVFLLGTVTYTVFDPIRSLMVQGKMLEWFDYKEFRFYRWLRANAIDAISSLRPNSTPAPPHPGAVPVWRERGEAVGAIRSYLSEYPTTIEFIHGPQGSGKTTMLEAVLKESGRKALIIDCGALQHTTSDSKMIASLAKQTGYWPVFTFLDSISHLVDLASVGLIGQKAGLSSSPDDQLRQILAVVGTSLKRVTSSHRAAIKRQIQRSEQEKLEKEEENRIRGKIRTGTWHDGRLDCVAGNGIMSELGVGDEPMLPEDTTGFVTVAEEKHCNGETPAKHTTQEDVEAVRALPVVVIRNFSLKVGSKREELLVVLAQWAATLAERQVAHVIVLSDNRENSKYLVKALPSKPLNSIILSDADTRSSVSFVKQKLLDASIDADFTSKQVADIERLGGRASDLESLIRKVCNGQAVEEAVESIISRGVAELRKNAFGDDLDDAKSLPWTREQAWVVLKLLSKFEQVPYHDILAEFPFKGDETSLRNMENAELISIGTYNGRPSTIRPGKPVLRWVFERLVNDAIFRASQEISYNEKVIANAEKSIKTCEEELMTISTIESRGQLPWWQFGFGDRGMYARSRYLKDKMAASTKKIGILERQNTELKRILAKGDTKVAT